MTAFKCNISDTAKLLIARCPGKSEIYVQFRRQAEEGDNAPHLPDGGKLSPGQAHWAKGGEIFTAIRLTENAAYGLLATLSVVLDTEVNK